MDNVYVNCPSFENEDFKLRMILKNDCSDLLKVYSDEKAVLLFNSDNCGGDDFHYTTKERMEKSLEYWQFEYDRKGFVRWSIIDKNANSIIGTIELFHRNSKDYFDNCGLLRLDLRSDYELEKEIVEILRLIISDAYMLFECDMIATKAVDIAVERIKALKKLGFKATDYKLIGHDGTAYSSYLFLKK